MTTAAETDRTTTVVVRYTLDGAPDCQWRFRQSMMRPDELQAVYEDGELTRIEVIGPVLSRTGNPTSARGRSTLDVLLPAAVREAYQWAFDLVPARYLYDPDDVTKSLGEANWGTRDSPDSRVVIAGNERYARDRLAMLREARQPNAVLVRRHRLERLFTDWETVE